MAGVSLYLLVGRDLLPVRSVSAGNIFAIGGVGHAVLKTGTISSVKNVIPFNQMNYQSEAIVRVAIEPELISDMAKLNYGLKLLNQADANVQVAVQDTGEHVIICAGELHVERCVTDLRERFAKGIRMRVSPPLVSFRETIVLPEQPVTGTTRTRTKKGKKPVVTGAPKGIHEEQEDDEAEEEAQRIRAELKRREEQKLAEDNALISEVTPNKSCTITIRAVPLPPHVTTLLESHANIIGRFVGVGTTRGRYLAK
jgi:ribosome assembly protein 1